MKKVAVIDSGSGGINVLKQLFLTCHDCKFLYLADEKNAPYGEKTLFQLQEIAAELIDFLQKVFAPEIIVFACNTLTATAIEYVREKYPNIIFVGSQPALKPACQKYGEENVLLLATPTTIRESQFLHSYPNVATLSIDGLPTLIDENLFELENLIPLLQESLLPYSPKAIVLGCTHFEALKEVLSFKNAELFSSSEGIAKRLSEFCSQQGGNDVNFMTTGSGESLAKFYSYFLKLISQNVQNLN